MKICSKLLAGIAWLPLLAAHLLAQQQPPTPGVLTLHASARTVLLDVVVTDGHGHPVEGLKASNFRLLEDGKPQTLASVEEHHPPVEAPGAPRKPVMPDFGPNTWSNLRLQLPVAPSDSAAVVFLLDSLDSPPEAQMYVRQQLLGYFNSMAPGTDVAIFQLDTQLRLLQGFTTDPAVLRAAIKDRDKVQLAPLPGGRQYAFQAMRMDSLTAAMQTLGSYLQSRPGRKNLIWFTGRIPRTTYDDGTAVGGSLHDMETFAFDYGKATSSLVLGQVSVYPIDARGLQTDPAFSAAHSGPIPLNSATRFSTQQFYDHTDLDQVAEATGGKAFYNTNGIKQAVAEVVATGKSFYTLSFYPTNTTWDGGFRKLKLDLDSAAGHPQADLEYRRGYYALNEAPSTRVAAPPPQPIQADAAGRTQLTHNSDDHAFVSAMALGAVDPNQIVFKARVFVDPATQKLPRLAKNVPQPHEEMLLRKYRDQPFRNAQVLYFVPGHQLQFSAQPDGQHRGQIEFVVLLYDPQGTLVGSSSSTLDMGLKPATYTNLMQHGLLMPVKFSLPQKGSFFLRVGVHDLSNGRMGAFEVATGAIKVGPLVPSANPPAPAAQPPPAK